MHCLLRAHTHTHTHTRAQEQGGTEQLHEARDVLRSTRLVVERFRCEAAHMMRGHAHEHLLWITASRNQPNDAVAKLVESGFYFELGWGGVGCLVGCFIMGKGVVWVG